MPMQSRSDQIQSYQFFVQRVISGLVAKESDPAELPFRRLGWSGFGGIMLAALVTAGFGVYGILVGGGATSWRDGQSVIVEKETGTPYIYRVEDDRLHPMVNFTSAQLAVGGGGESVRVSRRSLEGVPRGPTLGIPGAPEGLYDTGNLLTGGWSSCTERYPDGRGGQDTVSVLAVGRPPDGGAELAGEHAVLVRDVAGDAADLHLVWNGHRFALSEVEPVLRALGASRERVLPVASAWLDSLPVGEELGPPRVPDPGSATAAFGEGPNDLDLRTGQVIEAAGAYYLVRADDLREITELEAEILLAVPATAAAYPSGVQAEPARIPPGLMARAAVVPARSPDASSAPSSRPELASLSPEDVQAAAICAVFAPGEFVPAVWAGSRLPWQTESVATPLLTPQGALLADRALVAGGRAALVQAMPSPEADSGSWHVVTDQGVRYPLPRLEVAAMLGLDLGQGVRVPAALLARLPAGPALDPVAAELPVPPEPLAGDHRIGDGGG